MMNEKKRRRQSDGERQAKEREEEESQERGTGCGSRGTKAAQEPELTSKVLVAAEADFDETHTIERGSNADHEMVINFSLIELGKKLQGFEVQGKSGYRSVLLRLEVIHMCRLLRLGTQITVQHLCDELVGQSEAVTLFSLHILVPSMQDGNLI